MRKNERHVLQVLVLGIRHSIFYFRVYFRPDGTVSGMDNDTISRQAAIDTVMKFMPSLTTPDGCGQFDKEIYEAQEMFVDIGQALNDLPSAERHGRWIKKYRGNYLCSVCGAWYRTTDDYGNIIDGEMTANYCESCGAKMDEVLT